MEKTDGTPAACAPTKQRKLNPDFVEALEKKVSTLVNEMRGIERLRKELRASDTELCERQTPTPSFAELLAKHNFNRAQAAQINKATALIDSALTGKLADLKQAQKQMSDAEAFAAEMQQVKELKAHMPPNMTPKEKREVTALLAVFDMHDLPPHYI